MLIDKHLFMNPKSCQCIKIGEEPLLIAESCVFLFSDHTYTSLAKLTF